MSEFPPKMRFLSRRSAQLPQKESIRALLKIKALRTGLLLVSALPLFGAAHISSLDCRCGYLHCALAGAQTSQRRGWRPASAMIALPPACTGHTLQPPNHVLDRFIHYFTGAFTFYVPFVGVGGSYFSLPLL